jgi:hypothetical protein
MIKINQLMPLREEIVWKTGMQVLNVKAGGISNVL